MLVVLIWTKQKIEQLSKGIPTIYENGLEKILRSNLKIKKLLLQQTSRKL